VVHTSLGQHRVVLNLRLAKRRAVVRDQHELALALAKGLERGLVAERHLTGSHDDREARVDTLLRLLGTLLRSHVWFRLGVV